MVTFSTSQFGVPTWTAVAGLQRARPAGPPGPTWTLLGSEPWGSRAGRRGQWEGGDAPEGQRSCPLPGPGDQGASSTAARAATGTTAQGRGRDGVSGLSGGESSVSLMGTSPVLASQWPRGSCRQGPSRKAAFELGSRSQSLASWTPTPRGQRLLRGGGPLPAAGQGTLSGLTAQEVTGGRRPLSPPLTAR